MSDEELDQLFRHGAAAYPDDEAPLAGWWHLSQQLDELAQQQQLRRRLRRRVAGLFALEIGLVALWLLWKMPVGLPPVSEALPQRGPLASATTPRAAGTTNSSATPPSSWAPPRPFARISSPVPPRETTAPADAPASVVPRPSVEAAAPARGLGLAAPAAAPTTPAVGGLGSLPNLLIPALTSAPTPANVAAATPELVALATDTLAVTPTSSPLKTEDTTLAPTSAPPDSVPGAGELPSAGTDSARQQLSRRAPAYRLLVGVVGGPELTTVLASGPGPRLGGTVGVTAEYRLNSRLRVRSGLLRSVKRYAARGSDYNPPPYYWTWRVPVEQVDANCRILEIPLDVRYEVITRPAYSLYATAGLTSLLMRHERYTYLYELNGQYLTRSWSLARGSNAALRMVTVSLGLERSLGGRWVAQAEPFARLPLSGVGFGNVQLSSAGLLLGVRYGLLRARAPAP